VVGSGEEVGRGPAGRRLVKAVATASMSKHAQTVCFMLVVFDRKKVIIDRKNVISGIEIKSFIDSGNL
jgi:hypothetical protein